MDSIEFYFGSVNFVLGLDFSACMLFSMGSLLFSARVRFYFSIFQLSFFLYMYFQMLSMCKCIHVRITLDYGYFTLINLFYIL